MNKLYYIVFIVFLFGKNASFAQTDKPATTTSDKSIKKETVAGTIVGDTLKAPIENPLAPARAAFYSAIVPGLGQAYNKKYWKIPLVYGALGTTIYFYINNNRKYHEYRDIYKRRLEGYTDDVYYFVDNDRIIRGQKFYQRNRDLSALLTALFYILNVVDANVDAHLMQFNVNDKLTVKPDLNKDDFTSKANLGIALSYKF